MNTVAKAKPEPSSVLGRAFLEAGRKLGLSQSVLEVTIARNRSSISRNGIDPASKSGELALLLIRIYRSLFALMGGDEAQMAHWMKTRNRHTGGIPAEQIRSVQGLVGVVEYLDAMRGKI
ncbi:MbcA/ParS/Xre antitoxin family protein [Methylococcus mesophilus]|uniref:MbcA/ParS/Xre antitoxin family protein n=1 Tax=Methylococcus mesophilus TaxID=2993564 RepID=UPI00224B10BB|nr:MbcA/ParS/Xre antitoxin family protein [Methylococcus mesophilus]UZR27181.1 MbcA/ParS/Xre antitoxin family protein [Methylococcus mesophilus]